MLVWSGQSVGLIGQVSVGLVSQVTVGHFGLAGLIRSVWVWFVWLVRGDYLGWS